MGIYHAGYRGRADAPNYDAMSEELLRIEAMTPEQRAEREARLAENRARMIREAESDRANNTLALSLLEPVLLALAEAGVDITIQEKANGNTLRTAARMGGKVIVGRLVTERRCTRKGAYEAKEWQPEAIDCIASTAVEAVNGNRLQVGVTETEIIAVIRNGYSEINSRVLRAPRSAA